MWSWYVPSMTTTGPRAQAPRQLTVSSVKARSSVVSPGLDGQLASDLVEHLRGSAHVAGGARANRQQVASPRGEAEGLVEVGQPEHLDEGHVELLRHPPQDLFGQVAVQCLQVLQDFHDVERFRAAVLEDRIDFAVGP